MPHPVQRVLAGMHHQLQRLEFEEAAIAFQGVDRAEQVVQQFGIGGIALDVELPATEWDSIGGLLFNVVGGVPREGQEVEFQGLRLRAERVQGRRIGRVRIHRLVPPEGVEDTPAQARRQ